MVEEKNNLRGKYLKNEDCNNFVCTDEYGFITETISNNQEILSGLKLLWYTLIDKFELDVRQFKAEILKNHLLEKGVPLSLKHRVWKDFIYHKSNADYERLSVESSAYEYQIHVDVQRTFRHHFLFYRKYGRGQTELFNVLTAYSNYNKKVGYCQGMSDICAILLMYFCEKEAFEMFVALFKRDELEGLFDKELSKLPEIIKKQDSILALTVPDIYCYLSSNGADFSIYGMGWYLTLFSRFDIKLVLRIWDFFMFYGFNSLMYFASAILEYCKKEILEVRKESLLELMSKLDTLDIDPDIVVSYAVDFMKKLEYKNIKLN